jgi:hypothetical protein
MGYLINGQEIPSVSCPKWREWSAPVYRFLSQPRSWPELRKWAQETKVMPIPQMTQCLAWLDHMKIAYTMGHDTGDVRWISVPTAMFDDVPDILAQKHAKSNGNATGGKGDAARPLDEEVDGGDEANQEQNSGRDLGGELHVPKNL